MVLIERKAVQAINRTNTNDHLLRTHMYSSHARTKIITYTEPLKNDPFAMPLKIRWLPNEL